MDANGPNPPDDDAPGLVQRFADLVTRPEEGMALDEPALLIAAHAHPGLDVAAEIRILDDLAAGCPQATFEGWRRHVFVDLGFSGNVGRYHEPANSYLNEVVRRRMGLPITLSVVGIELGRRIGLTLVGVGMPGHFLLRSADDPDLFVDPFDSGRVIDRAGCEERFRSVLGNAPARAVPFLDSYLEPVGPRAVLTRMLANLKSVFYRQGDLANLEWVLSLRLTIPGVPAIERRDRARARAASGLLVEAADELEELAMVLPDSAEDLEREALSLRARLN